MKFQQQRQQIHLIHQSIYETIKQSIAVAKGEGAYRDAKKQTIYIVEIFAKEFKKSFGMTCHF